MESDNIFSGLKVVDLASFIATEIDGLRASGATPKAKEHAA
jgi:hypothetical protein